MTLEQSRTGTTGISLGSLTKLQGTVICETILEHESISKHVLSRVQLA